MIKFLPLMGCLLILSLGNRVRAEDFPGLKEPLKTVTVQYLVVQKQLSSDSFDGVTAAAAAMKTAMAADKGKTFAPDFAKAVDDLAAATDLHTARVAFQAVSRELIVALALNQVQTGSLHVLYCPMIKAHWVQADGKTVLNPYYGSAMLDCGEFQKQF